MRAPTGVLLMTFGSAVTSAEVPQYLTSVRGGRPVPDDVLAEFRRRYDRIGRSPLIDITLAQGEGLQRALDATHASESFVVKIGMLHSEPRIGDAIEELTDAGIRDVIAIVLAPQYSPIILAGYERAIAGERDRFGDVHVHIAGAWHEMPAWIDALAQRVTDTVASLPTGVEQVPTIFTAHSLPESVVQRDSGYIDQLRDTARAVAQRLGLADDRWLFAYQSAGHTPEPWLKPDVKDLLPGLHEQGVRTVVVAPVQFLADHLEVLYDIDVAAVDEARELGIDLRRIPMPNASPELIDALVAVVDRELSLWQRAVEDSRVHKRGSRSRREQVGRQLR